MGQYKQFGKFYDAIMGDRAKTVAYICSLITRHKPDAKTLLELACGTGANLKYLSRDYEVTGLDLSPQMLAIARKKLPGLRFVKADMVSFDLSKDFDVIICASDSINHVLGFSDWRKIFGRVAAHLDKGGIFIFDINTERKLRRHIKEPPWVKDFDGNLLIMDITDVGHRISNWNIKVFERKANDTYRLFEEDIQEISFPAEKIKKALLEKFSGVKIIDRARVRPSNMSEQLYFVCEK